MGVNGTAVAPHGLILGEDEATPSRKLFKHLPGPPGPVFGPKTAPKINNLKNQKKRLCFLCFLFFFVIC